MKTPISSALISAEVSLRSRIRLCPISSGSFHMAYSQPRASYSSWDYTGEDNGSRHWDSQPVLDVLPLTCVPPQPFGNATTSTDDINPSPVEANPTPPFAGQPAMVFLPSHASDDEWNNIIAATKSGVALTGTAALGKVGPAIGSVDIAESLDEYVFRVSLPGVARDQTFTFDVQPDGKIMIKGVTSTGEKTVYKNNMVFQMQTQNLCPPGEFSVSFQLPGPIDCHQVTTLFGSDGTFEGVVKKRIPTSQ